MFSIYFELPNKFYSLKNRKLFLEIENKRKKQLPNIQWHNLARKYRKTNYTLQSLGFESWLEKKKRKRKKEIKSTITKSKTCGQTQTHHSLSPCSTSSHHPSNPLWFMANFSISYQWYMKKWPKPRVKWDFMFSFWSHVWKIQCLCV